MPSWPSRLLSTGSSTSNSASGPSATSLTNSGSLKSSPVDVSPTDPPLHGVPALPILVSPSSTSPMKRPSRHGRSISHPFPSLFGSGKRSNKRGEAHGAEGDLDTGDEEVEYGKSLPRIPSQKAVAQHTDHDLTAGNCATCGSLVRWPRHLSVYRCTVCLMINDLKPNVHNGTMSNDNSDAPDPGASHSTRIPRKVVPLSLDRTKKLIDQCIMSYLRDTKSHNKDLPCRGGTALSAERIRSASAPLQQLNEGQSWDVDSSNYGPSHGEIDGCVDINTPGGSAQAILEPPWSRSPVNFSKSSVPQSVDIDGGRPPSRTPPCPPTQDHSHTQLGLANMSLTPGAGPVKHIFRQLEIYMASCLSNCDCLNSSFDASRPSHPIRAASEASLLSEKPKNTNTFKNSDASLSALDAKTVLLGSFAENGIWWTGGRRHAHNRDTKEASNGSLGEKRLSRVDWKAVDQWYDAIYSCGSSWRKCWQSNTGDSKTTVLSLDEEEELDEAFAEARLHVQRTFLKGIENLLRRPGRALHTNGDYRFLLVLLANPLLYPQRVAQALPSSGAGASRLNDTGGICPPTLASMPGQTPSSKTASSPRGAATGQHSGIVKRILGLIANLPNECHQTLVAWFRRYSHTQFRDLVELVGGFVTYRLNRQGGRKRSNSHNRTGGLIPNISGPGAGTSAHLHAALGISRPKESLEDKEKAVVYGQDWQIKAAAKFISLLFSANSCGRSQGPNATKSNAEASHHIGNTAGQRALRHGQILPTSAFYNTLLDYADLIADFECWESRAGKFSFCQYPMFLSIWAKIHIMEYDARRQMEVKAREAFFNSILSRKAINQYLVLKVRRDCLVDDSLRGVSEVVGTGQEEIKKGLRIEFVGEEGVDAGGLRKEWFLLLVREVFDPEHGLFVYDEESHYCYFNPISFETSDQFFLVGVVFGLAIYNSTILDVALPPFAFKKLLAAAPVYTGPLTSSVRPTAGYTLDDLAEWRPSLAKGLKQLLDHEGDVRDVFARDFVVDIERYGQVAQVPLCSNGENRPVDNSNRHEFVELYIRYLLDTAVVRQFEPFKRGFFTVCAGNALSLFRPEEIELLVRGSDEPLDVASLRAVAIYEGWDVQGMVANAEGNPIVSWFWDAFMNAELDFQRKILGFITGSDRIPAMGATNLTIKICCLGDNHLRYPIARTCFNQLGLFKYRSRTELEDKLWRAIHESEGFGLK